MVFRLQAGFRDLGFNQKLIITRLGTNTGVLQFVDKFIERSGKESFVGCVLYSHSWLFMIWWCSLSLMQSRYGWSKGQGRCSREVFILWTVFLLLLSNKNNWQWMSSHHIVHVQFQTFGTFETLVNKNQGGFLLQLFTFSKPFNVFWPHNNLVIWFFFLLITWSSGTVKAKSVFTERRPWHYCQSSQWARNKSLFLFLAQAKQNQTLHHLCSRPIISPWVQHHRPTQWELWPRDTQEYDG